MLVINAKYGLGDDDSSAKPHILVIDYVIVSGTEVDAIVEYQICEVGWNSQEGTRRLMTCGVRPCECEWLLAARSEARG